MVEITLNPLDFRPMEGRPDTYVSIVDGTIMVCQPGQKPWELIADMKIEAKAEELLKDKLT